MTDATELDEAAITEWREQSEGALRVLMPPHRRQQHERILAALDEIARLRAALDEARAEVERSRREERRWHDVAFAEGKLAVRAERRLEAAESALAAVRVIVADYPMLVACHSGWAATAEAEEFFVEAAAHRAEAGVYDREGERLRAALATPTTTERSE